MSKCKRMGRPVSKQLYIEVEVLLGKDLLTVIHVDIFWTFKIYVVVSKSQLLAIVKNKNSL